MIGSPVSYTHLDVYKRQVKDWGPFGWAKPAIDIALEGGPQMTAYYLQQIASTVKNAKYYRLQPELYGADPTLDLSLIHI